MAKRRIKKQKVSKINRKAAKKTAKKVAHLKKATINKVGSANKIGSAKIQEVNSKIVKAIIFDLDGVLVNMPDGHYEALNKALNLFGAQIEKDEHYRTFNGLPTRKKIEILESQGRLPTGLKETINTIKQKYTKEIIPKHCVPDYSKIILLTHLQSSGFKLACCSNSIRETLHLMLRSAGLFDFFPVIIGNDEISKAKPNPEIYLKAFERLEVLPEECVIVEDSPYGIKAAEDSGAIVYKVRNTEDVNLSLFEKLLGIQGKNSQTKMLQEISLPEREPTKN